MFGMGVFFFMFSGNYIAMSREIMVSIDSVSAWKSDSILESCKIINERAVCLFIFSISGEGLLFPQTTVLH